MHIEVKHGVFHAAMSSKCSVVHVVRHDECYERIELLAKNDLRALKEYHTYISLFSMNMALLEKIVYIKKFYIIHIVLVGKNHTVMREVFYELSL